MITDGLLDLLQALATTFLGILPSVGWPDTSGWSTAAAEIASKGAWANQFIPLGPGAAAVGVILAWHLTCQGVSLLFVLLRKVRLSG